MWTPIRNTGLADDSTCTRTEGSAKESPASPRLAGSLPVRQTEAPDLRKAGRPRRVSRSPLNAERLGRLRLELSRIARLPGGPEQARDEILKALARAGLGNWTLPELSDGSTQRFADGSFRLQLVAHSIVINPWGAFRIVDAHLPSKPYFELAGREARRFELPPDAR